MPTPQQLRDRLLKKLKELFQLDQPDLDFGFYRIMHAKSKQVEEFLDKDLLKIVADAFGQASEPRKAELQAAYEKAIQTAKEFGAANPEETEPVKKAKAALDALKDTANNEGDVYDHLYRFFERYYEDGDFISRRYYTRENAGKAAPYAVPYNGEEVKLHWANADQYYIKTTEYFSNYTFDLTQSAEILDMKSEERVLNSIPEKPVYVYFHIVEATEGEHGNVRATEATKRYFIIHKDKPLEVNGTGVLTINFEYRPDPEKTGQENTWRAKRNSEAANAILDFGLQIADLSEEELATKFGLQSKIKNLKSKINDYFQLLKIPAPTENDRNRPLLAKYINQYTARNTMDYFIHKDLGGFLRRELDFYIKNEVMRLDDIENAEAPAVESYLAKIKVLRKIAGKLIDFLAQLEEFQKKLWLKKKFVVETNYCITLDRIPEELYPEIAANSDQHDEWVKLFAINEIEPDTTGNPGYAVPLTVDFLKANNKLLIDTRFYDAAFNARLIAAIENFDEQCDGLLIHSENFQALNLLQLRYKAQIKTVHIDPPYNTATSGFLYKNNYTHSSWMAMMNDRILQAMNTMSVDASFLCHIDENEYENLCSVFQNVGLSNIGTVIWDKRNPMTGGSGLATQHEYVIWRSKNNITINLNNTNIAEMLDFVALLIEKYGGVNDTVRKEYIDWINKNKSLSGGEKAYRYIEDNGMVYQSVSLRAPEPRSDSKFHIPLIHPITKKPCAIPPNGFSRTPETLEAMIKNDEIQFGEDETTQPRQKMFLKKSTKRQMTTVIQDAKKGKADTDLLGVFFPYCHPVSFYMTLLGAAASNQNSIIFDFFVGSGTSGHATINLNREDGGKRKYILVEMGDYFDTVLKPRIAKVVYSADWKDGKPIARHTGISHCFKYLRLESYEDTLNNLRFDENPIRDKALSAKTALKEDYMLRYLLDVETRDSQSLLNIDAFADPTAYTLKVKKPGTDEYIVCNVDLIETFNYLIGLRVNHIAMPQEFTATFKRLEDPEVPEDQKTKLVVNGNIQQIKNHQSKIENSLWWFRKVEGWVPKDPQNPNNGQREKVLIVWRKLTGDLEKDNLMLDEWFQKNRISTRDFEFDTIYVNGSNNLPNLAQDGDNWKVRLIEEEFLKRMWESA